MKATRRLDQLEKQVASLGASEPCSACGAPWTRSTLTPGITDNIGGACECCGRLIGTDRKPFVGGSDTAAILLVNSPSERPRLVYGDDDVLRLMPEDVPVWLDYGHPIHLSFPSEDELAARGSGTPTLPAI